MSPLPQHPATYHAVFRQLLLDGPMSRAELARRCGLSKQTLTLICRALETAGLIRQTGETGGHIGRRACVFAPIADAACCAVVDLGGTKVAVALSTLTGTLLPGLTEPTDDRGGQHVITQIARLCREAAAAAGLDWSRVRHAVIGVPGAPDLTTGRVMMAPNIPAFDTFDVRDAFAEALGCSVQLENDVNLSAEGERWALSAAAPVLDMAYVSVGTGIGCGLICDGRLLRGAAHAAGEIAFLPFGADPFDPQSRDCGALEQEAGSHGMRRRYQALSGEDLTVPEIFTRAEQSDATAEAVLEETARLAARAIAALAAITNPALVVLGGSIGARPDFIARVSALLPLCHPAPPEIRRSQLGGGAPLTGAARLGLPRLIEATLGG
ncbi:ROK family transcriptional regulator [Pannonibacter phragmitetus]|uniref:ROK family transcriptional regulator n=1 Tax=Pannonibacter phragmitetus TaxID=121719 RepID=A0A0U3MSV9_9HYPH|nr:ROK family transcriptional regulator [Pannonibacter phragmitetus]